MNIVECRDLSKTYGKHDAIKGISFDIKENTITGLIGRNGAGKTTLLKIMAGYYRNTTGEIKVFENNPFNNITVSANVIFIDDNMTFPSSINLLEILQSASTFYTNWNSQLAFKLLDYFSFNKKQTHQSLSKGMKSTFNMIIGLAARCPLTIFDEPTTGMDASTRKDFYRALLKDYILHPRTIILSSHLLNEMEDILEEVLLLDCGEKLLHMSVDHIKKLAVGLKGKSKDIERAVTNLDIFHKEMIGQNYTYIVVENKLSASQIDDLKLSGVEISPISADETCVYLTAKNKGGIDSVFDKSESI
ncbi:ABC transporter [Lottiidibacillus patelloidae]|uniref:ABC transporter n=1 Tax=Lottiidibacillus patelloidae TaxID=2670334 RepID=A0A263BVP0_9BACI|nr:ABC transporter ATP-binding protein [Lottiidibacillus patelloidae]OZM57789.1 ABC transporter [Lottiidibacillus patelloidae]